MMSTIKGLVYIRTFTIITMSVLIVTCVSRLGIAVDECGEYLSGSSQAIKEAALKKVSEPIEYRSVYLVKGALSLSKVASYVLRSRIEYSAKELHLDLAKLTRERKGFFVSRIKIASLNSDTSYDRIEIVSHVDTFAEIAGGTRLNIPYEVLSPSGEPLFSGEVNFTFIDMAAGRSARMDNDLWRYFSKIVGENGPDALDESNDQSSSVNAIPSVDSSLTTDGEVASSDLDFYKHVNTAVYIDYLQKAISQLDGYRLKDVTFKYRAPLNFGDKYSVEMNSHVVSDKNSLIFGKIVSGRQTNAEFFGEIQK